jgi:hypothetical protein
METKITFDGTYSDNTFEYTLKPSQQPFYSDNKACLHDGCSQCDGTGIRKDGLGSCVHMISCSCPRCSPYCL